jgi:hypothetical protein
MARSSTCLLLDIDGVYLSDFGGSQVVKTPNTWTNYAPAGAIRWFFCPFAHGFVNNTAGTPIHGCITLEPGAQVNRSGSVQGNLVAPARILYD